MSEAMPMDSAGNKGVSYQGWNELTDDDEEWESMMVPDDALDSSGEPKERMGCLSAWFNITNVTVGAGCLALPFAVKLVGLGLGLVLLVLAGLFAGFTVKLLLWTAVLSGQNSYQKVAMVTMGRKYAIFVDIVIILLCYSCVLSYTILIGDLIPQCLGAWTSESMHDSFFVNRDFIMLIAIVFIIFPLSLAKTFHFLRFTSFMAITCVTYVVGLIVYWAIENEFDDIERGNNVENPFAVGCKKINWVNLSQKILFAIPIMAFAYTSHIQIYGMFHEVGHKDVGKMMKIVWASISTSCTMYLSVATFGYLSFYNVTDGNILTNFTDENNALVALAKLALSITLIFSCPLFMPPLRENCYDLVFPKRDPKNMSNKMHVGITVMLVVLVYVVALVARNVEDVLAVTGCVCSTTIMYISPALFYITLRQKLPDKDTMWAKSRLLGAYASVIFGVVLMIAGTIYTVLTFFAIDIDPRPGSEVC